ncbi:MAG: TatD family hydrolase, partial [Verrucomicrobiae bacterium]|nr:TatD family hydrolase [Verrucomicrobiae bacterium]
PVPFRGKPCEPAMVVHTSNCLAELHGLSPEEMAEQTSRNAATFFRLDGPLLAAAAQETGCATEKA